MQVTGSNNTPYTPSRLSIRITDGQSLHSEVGSLGEEVSAVDVELCGPVVATYPKSIESELNLREMLTLHGIFLADNDCVVTFGQSKSIGYVAKVSAELATLIKQWRANGVQVTLSSPLERSVRGAITATRRSKNVHLWIEGGVTYVAYAEEMQLRYAEVIPTEGQEALINLLALLNEDYNLKKAQFLLGGSEGKQYYKTLREYFRRVELSK